MIRKPVQDFFLFLLGGVLFAAGIFLFTNQVMVDSGYTGMGWDGGEVTVAEWGDSLVEFFPLALARVWD